MAFRVDVRGIENVIAQAEDTSRRVWGAISAELDQRFDDAIASEVWPWQYSSVHKQRMGLDPSETLRGQGRGYTSRTVGSPRNIIDTGNLRQSASHNINGLTTVYRWGAPYSVAVHYGATLRNGGAIPARPWVDAVLGNVNVPGIRPYDFNARGNLFWRSITRGQ